MNLPSLFFPSRRAGIIFQSLAGALLLAAGTANLFHAIQAKLDTGFLLYLLLCLLCYAPLPLLGYRLYSLLGAHYRLERDGLRLRWGLRSEDVPIPEIEWVRPAVDIAALVPSKEKRRAGTLPLPWLRWPGALLGVRKVEGLGEIEFLASGTANLLLVAGPQRIYAISPSDPAQFIRAFNRIIEMGSLSPLHYHSVYPTALASRIWDNRPARILILTGLLLGLGLLVAVALAIPSRATVSLGFMPNGSPFEPTSSERLLLLPVLNGLGFLIDLALGLYFSRRPHMQPVAYLLWSASIVSAVVLIIGVGFMVR